MKNCVYCGSPTNLNTSFNITIEDGSKVVVLICDEHAEDASVKTAKEAYIKKKAEIDIVLAKAKELGLEIVEGHSLAIARTAAIERPQEKQIERRPKPQPIIEEYDEDFIPTDVVDRKQPAMPTVTGSAPGVEFYSASDLNSIKAELPDGALKGQAKIGVFEGRQGVPIALVQQRRDGLGTTNVQIVKKENDRTLQERFKRMADDSVRDNTPDYAKSGYAKSFTDCGLCRGSGSVKNGKSTIVCPKCNGSGIINLT